VSFGLVPILLMPGRTKNGDAITSQYGHYQFAEGPICLSGGIDLDTLRLVHRPTCRRRVFTTKWMSKTLGDIFVLLFALAWS
jgi:hypothetical protein